MAAGMTTASAVLRRTPAAAAPPSVPSATKSLIKSCQPYQLRSASSKPERDFGGGRGSGTAVGAAAGAGACSTAGGGGGGGGAGNALPSSCASARPGVNSHNRTSAFRRPPRLFIGTVDDDRPTPHWIEEPPLS